ICSGAVPSAQALAPATASARAHRGPTSYGGRPLVAAIRAVLGAGLWPRHQHSSSLSASSQVFLGDLFWDRTRGLVILTSSADRGLATERSGRQPGGGATLSNPRRPSRSPLPGVQWRLVAGFGSRPPPSPPVEPCLDSS